MASTNLIRASRGRSRLPEAADGLRHPPIRRARTQPRHHNKGAQGSIRTTKQNGTFSHATPHLGGKPWQTKLEPKHKNHPAFTFHPTPSQDGISEVTNYDLIQGGPTRGKSFNNMTIQGQQRTLPEPSTTVNAIRNHPESQLDTKKGPGRRASNQPKPPPRGRHEIPGKQK